MNKENCALKFVDEIILYYDARSKKHQITNCVYKCVDHQHRSFTNNILIFSGGELRATFPLKSFEAHVNEAS